MFSLHSPGRSRVAEAHDEEFHLEQPTGPLYGELADLYVASLIIVPLALLMKSFLF
jgi:hypothetical protein